MSLLACSFCSHVNPAGSKFCNECGSPLAFKPCSACDAVNDVGATTCHQCGATGTPSATTAELFEQCGAIGARSTTTPELFEQRLDALRRDAVDPDKGASEPAEAVAPCAPPVNLPALAPPALGRASRRMTTSSHARILFAAGTGLIVAGMAGYAYSVYGPSTGFDRWVATLRPQALLSVGSSLAATAPSSITEMRGDATSSAPGLAVNDAARGDAAASANPVAAAADPSTGASSETARGPEPNRAPLQPPVPTPLESVTSPGPASQTVAESASSPAPTSPVAAESVTPEPAVAPPPTRSASAQPARRAAGAAPATKLRPRLTAKSAGPGRSPARHRPSVSQLLLPGEPIDTPATTALPERERCTREVAALGLCH